MTTTNGFRSSEDELFVDAEPAEPLLPFTFQSDLSDDYDDNDVPHPLPLDEIATRTLATLDGTVEELDTPPEDKHDSSVQTEEGPATAQDKKDRPRIGVTPVTIEVRLPCMPPARQAEYRRVKVDDYRPEEDEHIRPKRRRRAVSRFPRVACSLKFRSFLSWKWDGRVGFGCWRAGGRQAGRQAVLMGQIGDNRPPVFRDHPAPRSVDGKRAFRGTGRETKSPAERALPRVPSSTPKFYSAILFSVFSTPCPSQVPRA